MQERTVMCEGFAIKIRKVVTGGYRVGDYYYSRRVPKQVYYSITHEGRRLDSALKLSQALRLAKRAGLRLLREEIEHDTNLARQGLR